MPGNNQTNKCMHQFACKIVTQKKKSNKKKKNRAQISTHAASRMSNKKAI